MVLFSFRRTTGHHHSAMQMTQDQCWSDSGIHDCGFRGEGFVNSFIFSPKWHRILQHCIGLLPAVQRAVEQLYVSVARLEILLSQRLNELDARVDTLNGRVEALGDRIRRCEGRLQKKRENHLHVRCAASPIQYITVSESQATTHRPSPTWLVDAGSPTYTC